MLYSKEGLTPFGSNSSDPYGIITTTQAESLNATVNNTAEILMVLPEGIHDVLDQEAGDIATLCQRGEKGACETKYRGLIRSYCTRMPGFSFSGKKTIVSASSSLEGLISYPAM